MRFRHILPPLCALSLSVAAPPMAAQETATRVLFLSKSSGYEHSSIAWGEAGTGPSHVGGVLQSLAEQHELELTATKDASLINTADLERFDAVIFYTTGDLTRSGDGEKKTLFGGDGQPAMGERGVAELLDWIRGGGAFLGYHSASDTFHDASGAPSPYIEMLGGEFAMHGRQFAATVRVVDAAHPTMRHVPAPWQKLDEWYLYKNMNREKIHVLALLDPGEERKNQPRLYDVAPYPVVWCRTLGEGRIYYNAMGHREDVWDDPVFQQTVIDALHWALADGDPGAEPNWQATVAADASDSGG